MFAFSPVMQENLERYVPLIYLLAAVPYAWLGLYAWRKRPAVAVTPFAWAMLGMSIWSFTYGLEIFFRDLETKLFLTRLEYIGIVSIPVFLLMFALEYTGRSHLLTERTRALLWIIPGMILLLVWTNEYHHLMWDQEAVVDDPGIYLLSVRHLLFFWVDVAFSYVLVLVASLLLIMELIQRPGVYRVQVSLVILGIIFPWLGSLIFVSDSSPVPELDIRPLFFLPTALGLSWAITRYRLLEILPMEHLTILQNMQNGVIVLNSHRRVLYLNPIAESLFGRAETDVIGQPISQVSSSHGEKLVSFLSSQAPQTEIIFGEGGQARVFEVSVSPVSSVNEPNAAIGPDRMIVLHDITQRKETESVLSRRESIMSAISLAAGKFLTEGTWEHNIPAVLESIGQAADVSRVYVFMNHVNEQGARYTSRCYEWAAPGIKPQIDNPAWQHILLPETGFKRWEERLSDGQAVHGLVREFPESERIPLDEQNILSLAILPIFVENQWWGFIGFDDCIQERHWSATELEGLHIVANIFGSAETRARTEQKLLRRQKTLGLLHEIVLVALRAEDLQSMAQDLVGRLAELIGADGCFISLWNEANRQTFPLAAYGPHSSDYLSRQRFPGEHTFAESAVDIGHPVIVDDIKNSVHVDREYAQKFQFCSVLLLPLIAGRKKLGAIVLSFDVPHVFQAEEVSISEQAAGLIALAFEKFQVIEEVKHRAYVSETLRKAGMALTETLETNEAMTRILEQLRQVVHYDSASIQLLNENELEIVGGSGWDDLSTVIGVRFPIPGDNPNSVVIASGKPYLLSEVGESYAAFLLPPHDHIRSWLGVPLIVQEDIIGLLAIDSSKPNHFTKESQNVVVEFAEQVAIVLKNTRLLEETRRLAIIDPLTGLYNRRGLFELGKIEFGRSNRLARPFSGIMLDIDHFKEVNDSFGHDAGDRVLEELAKRCKKCLREIDLIGRYGGEEFVALLPETDVESGLVVAERLRRSISTTPIHITDVFVLNITASLGVAYKDENTPNLETLIARADQAMYIAKHKGRDRVALSR